MAAESVVEELRARLEAVKRERERRARLARELYRAAGRARLWSLAGLGECSPKRYGNWCEATVELPGGETLLLGLDTWNGFVVIRLGSEGLLVTEGATEDDFHMYLKDLSLGERALELIRQLAETPLPELADLACEARVLGAEDVVEKAIEEMTRHGYRRGWPRNG